MKRIHTTSTESSSSSSSSSSPPLLLTDDVISVVLRKDSLCLDRASRERDLFNFLCVSRLWFFATAIVIEEEITRSDAPLYASSFSENEDILRDQLSVMRHQDWVIDPLVCFLAPRLFQPYRATARANRVIHMHCTSPAYLDDTMSSALALVMRFLELSPGRRYAQQLIIVPSAQTDELRGICDDLRSDWEEAIQQVDPGVDNPFIVIRVPLNDAPVPFVAALLDLIDSEAACDEYSQLQLPPGTNLIVLWQSHYAGYAELPLECLCTTQLVIRRRMEIQGLQQEIIGRINSHILLFANR